MKSKTKIAGVAAAALTLTALGGGITQAQAAHPAATTSTSVADEVTGPDTDTLQQGDQTTADTTVPAAAVPAAAPVARVAAASKAATHPAATGEQGNETAAENQGESETETASDGPGGHEDPPGDVQHEGGAGEQ